MSVFKIYREVSTKISDAAKMNLVHFLDVNGRVNFESKALI